MIVLNCGGEVGEILDMGEPCIVVGEDCTDPYADDPGWYPETRRVERHDDGSLTVSEWDELPSEIRDEIAERHDVR